MKFRESELSLSNPSVLKSKLCINNLICRNALFYLPGLDIAPAVYRSCFCRAHSFSATHGPCVAMAENTPLT